MQFLVQIRITNQKKVAKEMKQLRLKKGIQYGLEFKMKAAGIGSRKNQRTGSSSI